jgi:hypothetical protein
MADPDKRGNRAEDRQADDFDADLHPDLRGGRNRGVEGPQSEKDDDIRTAYDIKRLHNRLQDFQDDDLKQIPVLPKGTRLEQNATYIDLAELEPGEFTARGDMVAGRKNRYVPKAEVDYQLWNRLIGVDNPERTGEASER